MFHVQNVFLDENKPRRVRCPSSTEIVCHPKGKIQTNYQQIIFLLKLTRTLIFPVQNVFVGRKITPGGLCCPSSTEVGSHQDPIYLMYNIIHKTHSQT